MAKQTQTVVQLSGKLDDIVFVKSRVYGDHTRQNRGSVKPAPLNKTLQDNVALATPLTRQAKQVHDQLKIIGAGFKENGLWQVMLKQLWAAGTADTGLLLQSLAGLELNSRHPLTRFVHLPAPVIKAIKTQVQFTLNIGKRIELKRPYNSCRLALTLLFFDKKGEACGSETIGHNGGDMTAAPLAWQATVKRPKGSVYWLSCAHLSVGKDDVFEELLRTQGMAITGSGRL